MTLDEMRKLDAVKGYKELEESKAEIERLRKANFQLREGAEEQKQRIKRLEEAGEKMVDEPLRKHRRWILNEAKEDKP